MPVLVDLDRHGFSEHAHGWENAFSLNHFRQEIEPSASQSELGLGLLNSLNQARVLIRLQQACAQKRGGIFTVVFMVVA